MNLKYADTGGIKKLTSNIIHQINKNIYTKSDGKTIRPFYALLPRVSSILDTWDDLSRYLVNISDKSIYRLSEELALNVDKKNIQEIKNTLLKILGKDHHLSARLSCTTWWESRIRKESERLKELLFISAGLVQKKVSPVISREMLFSHQRKQQNRLRFLSSRNVINAETRQESETLLTMAMAGIANPRIRKSELVNILLGTYQYAMENNHVCEFITLTLPPAFHAMKKNGVPCAQWNGSSPRIAHQFLEATWKKVRSALSDIPIYGTRVVEPHHDATPHWHIIVYMNEKDREHVISTFKKYVKKLTELGVNRLVHNEPVKNEAIIHYLMKCMASSVPGVADSKAKDDTTGENYTAMAERAKSWASLWGIRQFQHFGLPEIGVWRECRRIRSMSITVELGAAAEAVRHAADTNDFADYIRAQGGAGLKRSQRILQVVREQSPYENLWGETKTITVGIKCPNSATRKILRTRAGHYLQRPARLVRQLPHQRLYSPSCNNVNNCRIPGSKRNLTIE
ncbi:replication endonuclease [Raoultella ornithinolytica]|uniref:replication endonuclease n=1 Tax=Raoultella ornithinolytica TaxID=54291 RepID=UPI003D35A5B3